VDSIVVLVRRLGRSAATIKNAFVRLREMLGHAVGWGTWR
jgi:hypothetical protein